MHLVLLGLKVQKPGSRMAATRRPASLLKCPRRVKDGSQTLEKYGCADFSALRRLAAVLDETSRTDLWHSRCCIQSGPASGEQMTGTLPEDFPFVVLDYNGLRLEKG